MRLYLTSFTLTKIEYGSIEDGYGKLVLPREGSGYRDSTEVPQIIEVDYWEVFDE